jgi:hypothetical protein
MFLSILTIHQIFTRKLNMEFQTPLIFRFQFILITILLIKNNPVYSQ